MTEKKLIRNVKTVGDVYVNTGDLLKIDKNGHVYFIDRLGDTFRSDERLYFVGTIPETFLSGPLYRQNSKLHYWGEGAIVPLPPPPHPLLR